MDLENFHYNLAPESIAQEPVEPRSSARLLVATSGPKDLLDVQVKDLPLFLEPGDLIVVNETKVNHARLKLNKSTGAQAEVLLLEPLGENIWKALIKPGRRLKEETLLYYDKQQVIRISKKVEDGIVLIEVISPEIVEKLSQLALPPYIHKPLKDPNRYQTIFASLPGSLAAPTAGLHFDQELLQACIAKGAQVAKVNLSVGIGTFRPISTANVQEHIMHEEYYEVSEQTLADCRSAKRVIAVGTTTLRALESVASSGNLSGKTDLFIYGDYQFKIVDLLLTNFHLPYSSLLVLLEAFYGPEWKILYEHGLNEGYRFLSFGDAMLVSNRQKNN